MKAEREGWMILIYTKMKDNLDVYLLVESEYEITLVKQRRGLK